MKHETKIRIVRNGVFFLTIFYILHLPVTLVLLATFPCISTFVILVVNIVILHLLYYAIKELL